MRLNTNHVDMQIVNGQLGSLTSSLSKPCSMVDLNAYLGGNMIYYV